MGIFKMKGAIACAIALLAISLFAIAALTLPASVEAQNTAIADKPVEDINAVKPAEDPLTPLVAFEHCNFSGEAYALDSGTYAIPTTFANNTISALQVAAGYEVDVFEYAVFRGEVRTYSEGEIACLIQEEFNDVITSIIVRPVVTGTHSISGLITSTETGEPIAEAQVCTINYETVPLCETTASDGSYTINNVETGAYHILAYDPQRRFFANCGGSPCNPPKVEIPASANLDVSLNPAPR